VLSAMTDTLHIQTFKDRLTQSFQRHKLLHYTLGNTTAPDAKLFGRLFAHIPLYSLLWNSHIGSGWNGRVLEKKTVCFL